MVMAQSLNDSHFSKIRAALWPIHDQELKKFLPMALMLFLFLFNYTLLRNTKDALIITAPSCGAEVIPFVKIGDIPCAILFFLLYAKLSNLLSREALFYTFLIPFLAFFALFAFVIYPHKDLLHPSVITIEMLREAYPHLKWVISIYGVWTFALFYMIAESFGIIIVAVLFWQFANEITRTSEAKRFYPFFGFLGNLALIAAGIFGEYLASLNTSRSCEADAWGVSLAYSMTSVIAVGIGVILIYWWMNRYVLTDPFYYEAAKGKEKKEDKPKLSIKESLSYIFSSKYLGFIAIFVVSYGITMNLIDVTWKSQIKEYLPRSNDYFAFMGRFSFWTGIATMTLIMATKGIVRRFGWFTGAIITPAMFLITSILFFTFILFKDRLEPFLLTFGVTSLYMAVMVGAIQNIFSKGLKYSLADPTKEMAYIPLDQELKVKGKAAVDIIGGRFGKSGGGLIQFALLTLTAGTQLTIMPYLCGIVLIVTLTWMGAVKGLAGLYNEKVEGNSSARHV